MTKIGEVDLIKSEGGLSVVNVEGVQDDIENMTYVVRNQQAMIDSDLVLLYRVETDALNRAVKGNIKCSPEGFRLQLTKEEYEFLRCQFDVSKTDMKNSTDGHGGRRYLPCIFTEQGISMSASVLHSEVAVNVSIDIMRAFVEIRYFIASNTLPFERISSAELQQLQYRKQTDEELEQIFEYMSEHEESSQKIFSDGQIYGAFSLVISLTQKTEKEIMLIDGRVDVGTLNLLLKKKVDVSVTIYTQKHARLTRASAENFNAQYPTLNMKDTKAFYDRLLIINRTTAYHVGVSLKNVGKKYSGTNLIQDAGITKDISQRVELETEE